MDLHKIEVDDTQLEVIKNYYQNIAADKYNRMVMTKMEYESAKNDFDLLIPILKQLGIYSDAEANTRNDTSVIILKKLSYNKDWGWLSKAIHAIKEIDRPLTALQIIDELIGKYEPGMSRERAMNSLPATLSVAYKEGKINRKTNENKEYEYFI